LSRPRSGEREDTSDRILTRADRARFLERTVLVEEKLDGANVVVHRDEQGQLTASGRSGLGSADRAGQFGRLRAWVGQRMDRFGLLRDDECLYGEWLYLRHTVFYDRLPDLLVLLDVYRGGAFVSTEERDEFAASLGLAVPPVVHEGVLGSERRLEELVTRSAFGAEPVEGFVLRLEVAGEPRRLAKWIRPGYVQKGDEEWKGEVNRLAAPT
jgi:hypothetical protein